MDDERSGPSLYSDVSVSLLRPHADEMIATPVGTVVNSPKNESPQCIVPLNSR